MTEHNNLTALLLFCTEKDGNITKCRHIDFVKKGTHKVMKKVWWFAFMWVCIQYIVKFFDVIFRRNPLTLGSTTFCRIENADFYVLLLVKTVSNLELSFGRNLDNVEMNCNHDNPERK